MSIRLSQRMESAKSSVIREFLKISQQPGIISFAGGLPAPELFPVEEYREAANIVLEKSGRNALQYDTTEGFLTLREIIVKERMKSVGVNTTVDNIAITNGSQQGIDFSGRVFIDKDDVIICENPTYVGAINAFKAYMPRFVQVPMDNDGMIMEELENAIKNNPKAKFIYTIPDFHNPTGITLSLERRKRMVEISEQYDIPIIEDNPYIELRYEDEKIPAIKSFDTNGMVVYLGSFSKIFAPGIRIGWVCASEELLSKYVTVKQGADLQPSTITQRELAKFMEMYSLDKHIKKLISVYAKRKDLMIEMMDKEFPKSIEFTRPKGGFFAWITMPDGIDAMKLCMKALEEKVAFVPGASFFIEKGFDNYFRMNYSSMTEEKIIEGVIRLGKVLKSAM